MDDPTRFDLATGLDLAGGDIEQLWWRYLALGGRADRPLLADLVEGRAHCDALEGSRIAQALNELFLDKGVDTFPVAYEARPRVSEEAGVPAGSPRSAVLWREARQATRRSTAIARRAAELQAVAAELMQRSGRPDYARAARRRADLAARRAALSAVRAAGEPHA